MAGVKKAANKKTRFISWLAFVVPSLAAVGLVWSGSHHIAKPNVSIFEAARSRDGNDVKLLVESGTPVNSLSSGHTALFNAAENGDLETVDYLLKNGASPNAEAAGKDTVLEAAASSGNLAMVKELLSAGARLNTLTRDNETPLHAAADGGNKDIVALFVQHGAALDARRTSDHATPMDEAASAGTLACVEELAAHGADLNIPGYLRRTPLILAVIQRHYDVAAKLVSLGADLTKLDGFGQSALTYAFLQSAFDLAETIMKKMAGEHLGMQERDGFAAMRYTSMRPTPPALVRELLSLMPVNDRTKQPLMADAIRIKDQPLIDLLKSEGVKESVSLKP